MRFLKNYLMSNDVASLLVQSLSNQQGVLSTKSLYTQELKACVEVRFELEKQAFIVHFLASEARLYAELFLDSLSAALRNQLLAECKLNARTFTESFKPFEVRLWQGNRMYEVLPALKHMIESQNLKLELSTQPLTVENPSSVASVAQLYMCLRQALDTIYFRFETDGIAPGEQEGKSKEALSKYYERSPRNRKACLAYYGYRCRICDISFEEHYGPLGKQFIHVHHLKPLALSGPVVIDPIQDLIPACPNCHSMLHSRWPPLTPEELKSQLTPKKVIYGTRI